MQLDRQGDPGALHAFAAALAVAALVALQVSCASASPSVIADQEIRHLGPLEDLPLFVIAAKEKPRIAASLRDAGTIVVDDMADSVYLLRVTLGVDRSRAACGTLNNVKYALRADGKSIIELSARGWTGDCKPNVFDELSRALVQRIGSRPRSRGGELE